MVLVDTSVWLRSFYGREPYLGMLDHLLDLGEVLRHDLVFGELMIGDRGGRESFLTRYNLLPRIPQAPHPEVESLVRDRKLHGRGLSWIDAHLLASCLTHHTQLWTADSALAEVAAELSVAHTPSRA